MVGPPRLTPAQLEKFRIQAQAELEERTRSGTWAGITVPHTAYQTRPLDWIVEKLGVPRETIVWSMAPEYQYHNWDGDRDPLVRVLEAVASGNDCGVESGTGTGKTFLGACLVLWFLACFEDAIVVTAATTEKQLLVNIWKEIGRLYPRFKVNFPESELLTGKLRMRPAVGNEEVWAATAFVCGVGANEASATKAQGFHAEHMLIITEETPGIHLAIMTAFQNTRTDDHNIQVSFGNPDNQFDPLHQFCQEPGVTAVRVSALDHPNIVTGRRIVRGAIGPKRLEARTMKYGKGSRLYESRVRGVSPSEAADALIRWEWCVMCSKLSERPEMRVGEKALGVDVANSETGDKAAIARFLGATCTEVVDFPCPDNVKLGDDVSDEIERDKISPKHVGIDNVGVGAGTVNQCKKRGHKVKGIGGGEKAIPGLDIDELWSETKEEDGRTKPTGARVVEAERYGNKRDQCWWHAREDIRALAVALPYDEELFRDLCAPTYETKSGKIVVESKETLVDRLPGRRSPNKGDAFCYGNSVRRRKPMPRPAEPEQHTSTSRDWGLEKRLAVTEKRIAAERKRFDRAMKRLTRRRG